MNTSITSLMLIDITAYSSDRLCLYDPCHLILPLFPIFFQGNTSFLFIRTLLMNFERNRSSFFNNIVIHLKTSTLPHLSDHLLPQLLFFDKMHHFSKLFSLLELAGRSFLSRCLIYFDRKNPMIPLLKTVY